MEQINIYEAKTHFSSFIKQVESGEDVIIARNGKPVARLTSISQEKKPIRFGVLKGKLSAPPDFDEALPDAALNGFEGR